jgi:hypothetical protein
VLNVIAGSVTVGWWVRSVEPVEGGGGVLVGQEQYVAVDAKRGGGVAVAQPVLRQQEMALGNKGCRDGVAEAVKGDFRMSGVPGQGGVPVSEGGCALSANVLGGGGEQPRAEWRAGL